MRLTIEHTTVYRYDEAVPYSLQRLRLTPSTGETQTVRHWSIDVEGANVGLSYNDQFDNVVKLVETDGPQTEVKVTAKGEVETHDTHGVLGTHLGNVPLWLYLRDTPLTKPGKLIRELAKSVSGENELAKLHALMAAVHSRVEYLPGATTTQTTGEQALESGKGVCQDHSHIFSAAARLMGIPARYVSGYLLMDGVENQVATHAWAEAHVSGLGWVGFDAANLVCPDERYVRIATGLCFRDCTPVSGMRVGKSEEDLSVLVTVHQTQSQSQSQS
jgi:transglutaminase-like putative cysteine protease